MLEHHESDFRHYNIVHSDILCTVHMTLCICNQQYASPYTPPQAGTVNVAAQR